MVPAVVPMRRDQHRGKLTCQFCLQVDTTGIGKRNGTALALVGVGFLTSYTAIGEADLKCRRDPAAGRWAQHGRHALLVHLLNNMSYSTREYACWMRMLVE